MKAKCKKCGKEKRITVHHVLPRRFYSTEKVNATIELCWDCHMELEKLIPFKQMPRNFYYCVLVEFLST